MVAILSVDIDTINFVKPSLNSIAVIMNELIDKYSTSLKKLVGVI